MDRYRSGYRSRSRSRKRSSQYQYRKSRSPSRSDRNYTNRSRRSNSRSLSRERKRRHRQSPARIDRRLTNQRRYHRDSRSYSRSISRSRSRSRHYDSFSKRNRSRSRNSRRERPNSKSRNYATLNKNQQHETVIIESEEEICEQTLQSHPNWNDDENSQSNDDKSHKNRQSSPNSKSQSASSSPSSSVKNYPVPNDIPVGAYCNLREDEPIDKEKIHRDIEEKLRLALAKEGKVYPPPKPEPSHPVFANDGSFIEIFKKMQEQAHNTESNTQVSTSATPVTSTLVPTMVKSKSTQPPPPIISRRRGGKILKTGMVAKPKLQDNDNADPKDFWAIYLREVNKYKSSACESDGSTRPLVK